MDSYQNSLTVSWKIIHCEPQSATVSHSIGQSLTSQISFFWEALLGQTKLYKSPDGKRQIDVQFLTQRESDLL